MTFKPNSPHSSPHSFTTECGDLPFNLNPKSLYLAHEMLIVTYKQCTCKYTVCVLNQETDFKGEKRFQDKDKTAVLSRF